MFIEFVSSKYLAYKRLFDLKSLLGITYYRSILLLVGGGLIDAFNLFIVPNRAINIRLLALSIPIFLTLFAILVLILHGLLYWLLRILGLAYDKTIFATVVDKICIYTFPKQLYSSDLFSFSPKWDIESRSIYFGTILIIFFLLMIVLGYIFWHYQGLTNEINAIPHDKIDHLLSWFRRILRW